MKNRFFSYCGLLLLSFFSSMPAWGQAINASVVMGDPTAWPFIVEDIRVEGLQRLPIRVVYANLPFNTGDLITRSNLAASVKRLYADGKLQDIKVLRAGSTLIYRVNERPSISSIDIEGNKVIGEESLQEGLSQSGLEKGSVLQYQTLDRIKLELERQYIAQGRYGAKVEVRVTPKPRNRVAVDIDIQEGKETKIEHINIVGNQAVDDETLLDLLQLKSTHFWSFFKGDNKYAREKLSGDLEVIRSYYLDRGYINFSIESALVSVSAQQDMVFITLNIYEGQSYSVGEVTLAGDLKLPEAQLDNFLVIQTGQVFSRRNMNLSSELIGKRLGNEGYTFAQVKGYPQLNPQTQTIDVRFFVNPGKRIYVRRVEFKGNGKTKDEVLRREMRQMEGAWAQGKKIERSKARLERLGFFKNVQVETPVVPGTDDLVDLTFSVEEQPSGSIGASVGYQGGAGLVFGANVSQPNFLGTGNLVSFSLNRSKTQNAYNFRFVDPYYTVDGVSRGFNLFFRETDFDDDDNLSSYRTDAFGGGVNFGYPIDENQRLNFGVGYDNTRVYAFRSSAQEVKDFVDYDENNLKDTQSENFDTLFAEGSWSYNKLNRGLLPDRGFSHRASLEIALPGSDSYYFKAKYKWQRYIGLGERLALRLRSEVGYGDGWRSGDDLPFYKHFFSGGFGSVRGYDDNSLGPRDSNGFDAFGGNVLVEGGTELIVPTPFVEDQRSVRSTLFVDGGNVFNTQVGGDADFELSGIRYSAGVSLTWITAIGPVAFSLATPLNDKESDDTQKFQFSLGRVF